MLLTKWLGPGKGKGNRFGTIATQTTKVTQASDPFPSSSLTINALQVDNLRNFFARLWISLKPGDSALLEF